MQCTNQACEIILGYVFPSLGILTGSFVFLSPLPSILRMQRYLKGRYDSSVKQPPKPAMINPIPYAFSLPNAMAWTFYSFILQDYFIAIVNLSGCIVSIYYIVILYAYGNFLINEQITTETANQMKPFKKESSDKSQISDNDISETINLSNDVLDDEKVKGVDVKLIGTQLYQALNIILISQTIVLICAIISFIPLSKGDETNQNFGVKKNIFGIVSLIFLIFLYISPLSVLLRIIKFRYKSNAGQLIYVPLAVACILNGILWFCYGILLNDYFVWFPNGLAFLVGSLQVILVKIFDGKKESLNDSELQV